MNTVLIVDDELALREILADAVDGIGYKSICCEDGAVAVDAYREHHDDIGLVFLDIMMPVMDGRTCFMKLKEIDKNVRVVIITGFSSDFVMRALDGEAAHILRKPFSMDAVRSLVKQCLGGSE